MRSLRIVAHGSPAAQGSKKAFIRGKKVALVEMNEKLPAWRAAVEAAARLAAGPAWEAIDGAVSVTGVIRLPKPRTTKFPDHPAGPQDLDKLQRAIGDALTKSRVIVDDARICHWDIRKVWADEMPGMDITITELGGHRMSEIPEAAGRLCIIEWQGERREIGTIERAQANEDGSITVELEMHNGLAHYVTVPAQHSSIDYRESNLEAIREQIDNPLRVNREAL